MINLPPEIKAALDNGAALLINGSGGKDSEVMALELADARKSYGWQGRFILIHAHVGRMEWRESLLRCKDMAEKIGAEFVVVADKTDLLDSIWQRMKDRPDAPPFPSSKARYCTAGKKREPINKWIRRNLTGQVICAMGIRRQESKTRRNKPVYKLRSSCQSKQRVQRTVYDYHPVIDFSLEDVWARLGYTLEQLKAIQQETEITGIVPAGFNAHPAYALGNERVSCVFCVLGSRCDIKNGTRFYIPLYRELVDVEIISGFTFQQKRPLYKVAPHLLRQDQRAALAAKGLL